MEFGFHADFLHSIAGLFVGVLVGLTGVGGGSLMTPLLVLLFGVSPQTAVGTDLLFAAITKTAGSAVHGSRSTVDWKIVRRLGMGSVPASVLTVIALAYYGKVGNAAQNLILISLASLLALTAIGVLFRKPIIAFALRRRGAEKASQALVSTVVVGVLLGVAVSISSVGAGAIGVTVLLILYPRLPMVRIVGSDIAHAVPLALVAGTGHWFIGGVDGALLTNLLVGSIPGVIVGSLLSTHAPERVLQPLLAAVLLVSSWQLMSKARAASEPKPIEAVVMTSKG
jgi:uncharacterized protein